MSESTSIDRMLKKLPAGQRQAVAHVLANARPVKPVPSVLNQWLIWMALSMAAGLMIIAGLGPQPDLLHRLTQLSSGGFMALVFLGSALTAWNGIASSMPGEELKPSQKLFTAAILLLVILVPVLFFTQDTFGAVWTHSMESRWFCFRTVLMTSLPAWCFLGWMVARNAPFQPLWTAAWLSLAASLFGTGIIQTHCAHWEIFHVLVDHLLPMLVGLFLPLAVGSFWFLRWRERV